MDTLIMKFGGTSVGTTTGLAQVLNMVMRERERWTRLLIVVSALEGVTDALIEATQQAAMSNRRGYRRLVANVRTRHMALIESLPFGDTERAALQADVDRLLYDMLDTCQQLADHRHAPADVQSGWVDAIVGVGERLAARVIAALLRQNQLRGVAIDATDLLVTDNVHANATVNIPMTRDRITAFMLPMLERRIIPVITGFIGRTSTGQTTTLGRGGTDYTASVIALCTDADEIRIWTDVDGIMTADPRQISSARIIPALSYDEIAELSYFGARILHPRMVGPLRETGIPVYVRNIYKPTEAGTRIDPTGEPNGPPLKAVTSILGIALLRPHSGPLAGIAGLIDRALFNQIGSHADVMITAQSPGQSFICVVIPTTAGPDALYALRRALEGQVREEGEDWTVYPVTVTTVVGSRLNELHTLKARIYERVDSIPLLALSQAPSSCSLSLVTQTADAERVLTQIHNLIIENGR